MLVYITCCQIHAWSVRCPTALVLTLPSMYRERRDRDKGGWFVLDIYNLFSIVLLNLLSVLLTRKL